MGKTSYWCSNLQTYFKDSFMTIRNDMCISVGFNESGQKFPEDIMVNLIGLINDVNCGTLTRLQAESKILEIFIMINNSSDTVAIRILLCIKLLIDTLPKINQKKEIKDFELCTRYLQESFQKLSDDGDEEMLFKWSNVDCFDETMDDKNQNRPDGIVENDHKALGYIEVKPIKHAKNHYRYTPIMHFFKNGINYLQVPTFLSTITVLKSSVQCHEYHLSQLL